MGTEALTMVPTFSEDRKMLDKEKGGRKSSWKWILGSDDDGQEKDAKKAGAKEEREGRGSVDGGAGKKGSKLSKPPNEKARLDLLQNSIDGATPGSRDSARGRESLVLNRADIQLEEERNKDGSKKKTSSEEKDRKKDKGTGEKETGLLQAIFGSKKSKHASSDSLDPDSKAAKKNQRKSDTSKHRLSPHASSQDLTPMRILKPDIDYNWTRFSILEERAIYRMAHIKLANPRRALYSQVLLSNFMYSYLAKVQMMHPGVGGGGGAQQQQQKQREQQPSEYSQYQRWQEVSS